MLKSNMSSSKPQNLKLYKKIKNKIKKKYKNWPSAYASAALVKEYKAQGGTYEKGRKNEGVSRWMREKWVDVCHWPKRVPCGRSKSRKRRFPYCRPSVRISKQTPKLVQKMKISEVKKMCKRKRRNSRKRMPSLRRSRSRRSCVRLSESKRKNKKKKVTLKKCSVNFGGKGYEDFTIHKDEERKKRYLKRHKKRENWTKTGKCTAGFWSRHLLWGEKTIHKSKQKITKSFGFKFCL